MTQTANQGSVGATQQGPNDASSEFSKAAFLVRQLQAQVDTMMPVQVIAVYPGAGSPPAAGTVDVQLLVSQIDGNNNVIAQGKVFGLPYFRPQGGPWAIIIDPAVSDFGYIIAASRDISNVVKNPGIQPPGSLRKYNFADGIYVGGVLNAVPGATFWLKPDGTLQVTDKNGNVWQSTTSGWTLGVGGTTVLTLTSSLATFSVNVKAPDYQTPNLPSYAGHRHTQGNDSGGNTEQEVSPPVAGS